jgi:hypothetical protein
MPADARIRFAAVRALASVISFAAIRRTTTVRGIL